VIGSASVTRPPRSATERWVSYVLKACEAGSDLKTLESWAHQAEVSYTTLCATCRIMGIRPLDARDFMRVLRALKRASAHRCPPEVFLDVSDTRTVLTLSLRAGVDLESDVSSSSIEDFVTRQQFVAAGNQGLHLLRDRITGWQSSSARPAPNVLVIDADDGARQTFGAALRRKGFKVTTASTGAEAQQLASEVPFDLIVLDMHRGDIPGIDLVRSLREGRQPLVLLNGSSGADSPVETIKPGLVDALHKPLDVDRYVGAATATLPGNDDPAPANSRPATRSAYLTRPQRSATARWVRYVLTGCESDGDLKTLESWANQAEVSYTTLCATCRIMGIRPLDARDFMRVLRALKRAVANQRPPDAFLDGGDTRAILTLSLRAGIDLELHATGASLAEFLARQQFVAAGNQALHVIRDAVNAWQLSTVAPAAEH